MKTIDRLLLGQDLTILDSQHAFRDLFTPKSEKRIDAKQVLTLLSKKGEHAHELIGFVRAVQHIEKKPFKTHFPSLVDACGTGSDGANTFNISTISSFVAAGAGAYVAKHGNRSISSKCGSADLLEKLGVKIDAPPKRMLKALRICRIAYFHAPLYHPVFKTLQPLRSELAQKKIRTIFNLAGPLLNPLRPAQQMIGVFRKSLVPVIAQTAKKMNLRHAIIVWNYGGMDELTTTHKSLWAEVMKGRVKVITISPKKYGFRRGTLKDLKGGDSRLNHKIAIQILEGKDKGAKRDVVLLNAGAILYASGRAKNLKTGIELARRSMNSLRALHTLKQLVRISHGLE